MAYTVSGTLKLPDGTAAAGVDLRFVALTTFSPLIESAEQTVRTGANGSYSIALETSSYNVFVTYNNNRPFLAGRIVINSNTPAGQDLPTLLGGIYPPPTPEWIQQVEAWLTQAQGSATAAASSASAATTEANRSRTEADRSKSEADRASQISGLSTVADAIGLAALPLPDVWAPLSDSLRLITGYGRDVLVGSDVVARMVNFSRNSTATYIGKDGLLKTAAANEPRFEKEGLLIEGQSTNYITTSEGLSQLGAEAGATVVTENGLKLVQYAGAGQLSKDYTAPANAQLTFSFFVKLGESNTKIALQLRDGVGSGRTAYFDIKPTGELGVTDTQGVLVASSWKMNSVSKTVFRVSGTISSSDSTVYRIYRYAPVAGETFGSFQLEPLPFASSYIPTNGTAATRAADSCWLNVAGNHFANGTHAFYASCKNCGVVSATLTMRFISVQGVNQHFSVRATGNERRIGYLNNADTTFASGVTSFEGVIAVAPGRLSKMGSFTAQTSPLFVTEDAQTKQLYIGSQDAGINSIFGHVKNLRIWSKPLTNEQIKAVA